MTHRMPVRPGNDLNPSPRRWLAKGIFYAVVPAGSLIVAGFVLGLIVSGVAG